MLDQSQVRRIAETSASWQSVVVSSATRLHGNQKFESHWRFELVLYSQSFVDLLWDRECSLVEDGAKNLNIGGA